MRSTEDILLINKFDLYDNIATLENHKGRLRAEMVINPYPRINWNFEVLGEQGVLLLVAQPHAPRMEAVKILANLFRFFCLMQNVSLNR